MVNPIFTSIRSSIDILLDMNVSVTVTIGETSIPVRRLLQLAPGSVIRLDKALDEPVDLYLSKQIIGLEASVEENN